MNKAEYSAYPHENEFLIMDGADYVVEDMTKVELDRETHKEAHEDIKYYYTINLTQLNDWDEGDPFFTGQIYQLIDELAIAQLAQLSKEKEPYGLNGVIAHGFCQILRHFAVNEKGDADTKFWPQFKTLAAQGAQFKEDLMDMNFETINDTKFLTLVLGKFGNLPMDMLESEK